MNEKQEKLVGLDEALKEDNQSEGSIQEVMGSCTVKDNPPSKNGKHNFLTLEAI